MSQENDRLAHLWRDLAKDIVKVMPQDVDDPVTWMENFIKAAISERVEFFNQEEPEPISTYSNVVGR
jgi:hypothetical protein